MGCSNSTMQEAKTPRGAPTLPREKTTFVAFEIDLKDNESKYLNRDIDKILSKPLPKRLQRLEPLSDVPKMTSEDLGRKLELAELKRQKTFEKRLEFSRKGSVRRSIVAESLQNDGIIDQETIEERMKLAEKLRLQKLANIQEKQRIKSERAERVRQNARKMREEGLDELESQYNKIEHDASSGNDSWSDSDKKKSKKLKPEISTDSSGYSSRNISATKDEPSKLNLKSDNFYGNLKFSQSINLEAQGTGDNSFYDEHKSKNDEIDWSD